MADVIFWTAVALIAYTYFGYPALLIFLSAFRNNPVRRGPVQPQVTLIIAAHNEEQRIRDKIENSLSLNYPLEKREIIVTSDGSTDETNGIVSAYKDKGVILVAAFPRNGKEYAQWQAIKAASGDILVFSDVAAILEKDALIKVTSNFHDPTVGCVSSEDRVLTDNELAGGEDLYVKYEMLLRQLESRVHSLVGLSGSFFAIRRELCQEWSTTLPSDFVLAVEAVNHGYRAVSDPAVIGFYKDVCSEKEELQRKIRTVMRGIAVLMSYLYILNPIKYGFFSIQVISHKLLRWFIPLFMLSAFLSNILLLSNHSFYRWIFAGQLTFYSFAMLGLVIKRLSRTTLFKIPAFFTLVNISIAVAWIRYLSGRRAVLWEPSKR